MRGVSFAADLSEFSAGVCQGSSWIEAVSRCFQADPGHIGKNHVLSSIPRDELCFVSPQSGFAIAADAEIHNRADLLSRLSSHRLPTHCSDAALILAAYEKWGEDCPRFLLGEFSFAIWDSRRARLFCCRDHLGHRPFFYWTNGFRFVFSTDALGLFSLPGIARELNREKLAAWVTPDGLVTETHEETFHKGILSLPSATSLTFEGGNIKKRNYWDPESVAVRVPHTEQDAFDALRELLFDAVECRLRGKSTVAAYLSGGLDSSSLVAIAARCLEKSNRSILAIAAVLPDDSKPQFTDEREFIDEFRAWPNVDIEYVAPSDGGPFDGIEDSSRFESSPIRYSRQYLDVALQDIAFRRGADVILAGQGGETGPTTWATGYYLELAFGLNWGTLARELRRLNAVRHISPVRTLGGEILDFLRPARHHEPWILLARDFAMATADTATRRRALHWPDHRREQAKRIRSRMSLHAFRRGTLLTRVPATHPFLDKRVLEFCLAAPGNLKVRDGYQRYLIRRALDGILPKKIQWRTTKCAFAPDYAKRYQAQLGKARDFVTAIGRNDPVRAIVDVDRLHCLLNHPDARPSRTTTLAIVPITISLICFLRQFAEFRP
jgi:asparagine synthase (glutamine-hydrolysing)